MNPIVEADRHDGLHVGDTNPARLIALNGDVTMLGTPFLGGTGSSIINLAKEAEIFAGRDVANLALIGQNNNANDVTSIIAGRDVTYQTITIPVFSKSFGVEVGGPGNPVIESGRNVDLGSSTGIETFVSRSAVLRMSAMLGYCAATAVVPSVAA